MSEPTLTGDLIRNARDGDEAARNRLFERYLPRILRIVRIMMGADLRRQLDSSDLAQETMLEAVRRFDGFEPRGNGSLLNWLRALARSAICAAADRRNADKRSPAHEVARAGSDSEVGDHAREPVAPDADPLDAVAATESAHLLERCLGDLPEKERDLILLHHYAEQSWAEIASETGRASPDAARVAYVEAKARLAILMRSRSGR